MALRVARVLLPVTITYEGHAFRDVLERSARSLNSRTDVHFQEGFMTVGDLEAQVAVQADISQAKQILRSWGEQMADLRVTLSSDADLVDVLERQEAARDLDRFCERVHYVIRRVRTEWSYPLPSAHSETYDWMVAVGLA